MFNFYSVFRIMYGNSFTQFLIYSKKKYVNLVPMFQTLLMVLMFLNMAFFLLIFHFELQALSTVAVFYKFFFCS